MEHLPNIYRTSIEQLSNINRTSIEHLSNSYRTSIDLGWVWGGSGGGLGWIWGLIREVWKSHARGVEVSCGRCGSLMREVWILGGFLGGCWVDLGWILGGFEVDLGDVEKYLKMFRPRILIGSTRFPPFGFDITEMSFNSY